MRYLFILDFLNTLIEAQHVCCKDDLNYQKYLSDEYHSRLNYIVRKITSLLNNENRIVIITSGSHSGEMGPYILYNALADLDSIMPDSIKSKIEYYLVTGVAQIELIKNVNPRIHVLATGDSKDEVYEKVLKQYYDYWPIAIDDNPYTNNGFMQTIQNNGECILINNNFSVYDRIYYPDLDNFSKQISHPNHYLDDDIVKIIDYYEYISQETKKVPFIGCNTPNILHFSREELLEKLFAKTLDVEKLYSFYSFEKLKKYFLEQGLLSETIEELAKHNIIAMYPSFEVAFRKKLSQKIN